MAVTDEVDAAGTSASHCTVTGAGPVIVGGVVSLTVIVSVHVAELPHVSVARYVRVITRGHVPLDASPTKTTVVLPQLSDAVTDAVAGAGTFASHCTVTDAGHVTTGGVVSFTVIVCVHVAELPHVSVARYVRVMTRGQVPLEASPTNITVAVPQLSEAVTDAVAGAGTFESHCTVTGAGHAIVGGVVSFTVIVCVHVAEFPQASVARYVRVTVNRFAQVWPDVTSPT